MHRRRKVENWGFELGSVTALIRRGWSRDSLQVGEMVTVEGVLARQENLKGAVRTLTLSTGETLLSAQPFQGQ